MQPDLFAPAPETGAPKIFTVSEITRNVRGLLEKWIGRVWIEGEVCNLRRQTSGHVYFTLKDERSQLACVLFASSAARIRGAAQLADGLHVHARGEVTVYEARGQYQLVVENLQPAGAGLLQARFDALKRKLEAEGLFDAARKKKLPKFPSAIGVITSPTGAAIRDMLNILHRRAPWMEIVISPVRVQGEGAAEEIAAAVDELNRAEKAGLPRVEVIVLARGGGSAEDLWEFNEEILARAIFASAIPVVSAIGHEIDFTISDFVADLRASTPSSAAELIAPDAADLRRHFSQLATRAARCAHAAIEQQKARVIFIQRGVLLREPLRRIAEARQRVDFFETSLAVAAGKKIGDLRQRVAVFFSSLLRHRPDQAIALQRRQLEILQRQAAEIVEKNMAGARERLCRGQGFLRMLSPQGTLERGYSITLDESGKILRSAKEAREGTKLITKLRDGEVRSVVENEGKQKAADR